MITFTQHENSSDRAHSPLCTLCECIAENPRMTLYECRTNKKVVLCAESCFRIYFETFFFDLPQRKSSFSISLSPITEIEGL
jgi:hypothetical protein